jgi:amidase
MDLAYGLPFHFNYDMTDHENACETRDALFFEYELPGNTQDLMRLLNWHGAILLGATSCRFGLRGTTYNRVFGMCRNPYNPLLTTGDSSGGFCCSSCCWDRMF